MYVKDVVAYNVEKLDPNTRSQSNFKNKRETKVKSLNARIARIILDSQFA